MWYRRAAEQGDSLAQYSLGLLYESGQRRGSLPTQISIRSASANGLSRFTEPIGLPVVFGLRNG